MDTLKNKVGWGLALISIIAYTILLLTGIVFISTVLLLILVIVFPLIIDGLRKHNKILLQKRIKATSWAMGFFVLLLFPAFWLIPQQIYVRTNRQDTLITPDAELVQKFGDKFLMVHDNFNNLTFMEKAELINDYTMEKIEWRLDYENYGIAGHQATPSECIKLGSDDCQGQAVTLASVMLYLEFEHVWVVETPFHWYVITRDPEKDALEKGWEVYIEEYQENGELITLNRDGEGNMPDWRLEEVVLIFNNEETLYPVNALDAIWIGWTATAFFYDDIFPMFLTYEILFLYVAMLILAIPLLFWSRYMMESDNKSNRIDKSIDIKRIVFQILIIGHILFGIFFLWFILQPVIWDYTLILSLSEISILVFLSSTPKFWKFLHLD